MGTHMKTTVEIADALFADARKLAVKEKVTLRSLIEDGLRRVLKERRAPRKFKLRDLSVKGGGLRPGVSWSDLRDIANDRE
jgi:hypothetical protein